MLYNAPCSAGDLVDRITILEIKCERLPEEKAAICREELHALEETSKQLIARIWPLYAMLKRANEFLWDVEDRVRELLRADDLGPDFVAVARKVAPQNDYRAAIKRQINEVVGSTIVEMKSHAGL